MEFPLFIPAQKQRVLQRRPRGCDFNAAIIFYKFIATLYEVHDFPLDARWMMYLENCHYRDYSRRRKIPEKGVAFITPMAKEPVEEKVIEPVTYGDTSRSGLLFSQDQDALDAVAETRLPEMVTVIPDSGTWLKNYDTVDQEFWDWINSINTGFQYRRKYKPLEQYIYQGEQWLLEKRRIEQCKTVLEREDFIATEILRFKVNKYYFLNKYWRFKQAGTPTGFANYTAYEAQKILCFLYDCLFDLDIAKARQILFTTTMFGIDVCELLINYSFFIKIVTADTNKAVDTFRDKFKQPFYDLPTFIKPQRQTNVDPDSQLTFGCHFNKSKTGGGSIASIVPPSIDAVNSGSPNKFEIDEQGLIDIVTEMKNEMKAPAFKINTKTGKLEKKAQSISWGTSDMIQFPDFEETWKSSMDIWETGNYRELGNLYAIPIFFNVFARQGVTPELYEQWKKQSYLTTGPKRDETIIQFHQSFPIDREDMFMSNPNTLISLQTITESIQRIDALSNQEDIPKELRTFEPAYGYLVPIFDTGNTIGKTPDFAWHAIGAELIETSGPEDPRTTVVILRKPPDIRYERWINRFYKGSDPIMAVSGKSNFASVILDSLHMDIAGAMYFRPPDPKYAYQQSLLLNLYFGMVDELLEINIGGPYRDYVIENNYTHLLVAHEGLPDLYQIETSEPIGIAKKGNNTRNILNATQEYLYNHYQKINLKRLFVELKTFVNKPKPTNLSFYEPKNPKFNFDDVIDATGYAYICYLIFQHLPPKNVLANAGTPKVIYKRVRDGNGNLDMVPMTVYE